MQHLGARTHPLVATVRTAVAQRSLAVAPWWQEVGGLVVSALEQWWRWENG